MIRWRHSGVFEICNQDLSVVFQGVIKIHVELILANTLSEVVSNITFQPIPPNTTNQNLNHGVTATTNLPQVYDRDKQGWAIKCDCHSESIRIHMVYKDIQNVPRNHLRSVFRKSSFTLERQMQILRNCFTLYVVVERDDRVELDFLTPKLPIIRLEEQMKTGLECMCLAEMYCTYMNRAVVIDGFLLQWMVFVGTLRELTTCVVYTSDVGYISKARY